MLMPTIRRALTVSVDALVVEPALPGEGWMVITRSRQIPLVRRLR